jgi:hypothetical protein
LLTISGAMRQAKGELVPQLRVDVNPLDHGSPAVLGKEILRQAERQRQPPSEIGAVLLWERDHRLAGAVEVVGEDLRWKGSITIGRPVSSVRKR